MVHIINIIYLSLASLSRDINAHNENHDNEEEEALFLFPLHLAKADRKMLFTLGREELHVIARCTLFTTHKLSFDFI